MYEDLKCHLKAKDILNYPFVKILFLDTNLL